MDPLDKLLAVEGIRNVKARYWYCMDMKDWEGLRDVFAPDAIFDMRAERASSLGEPLDVLPPIQESIAAGDTAVVVGDQASAEMIKNSVEHWITAHHGHEPVIEVTSADSGTAIWPLFDYIDDGEHALKGYGHYHDEYRRIDGKWFITRCGLTRIRSDGVHPWSVHDV